MPKLTLIGMKNYLSEVNVDLFAAFDELPEGINKDTLVDNILLQGGEYPVMYADPYFLKAAMEPWLSKWERTFTKWVEALAVEYDPLNNYDRTEEWTDTHTGTQSVEGSSEGDGTGTGQISAYDTEDFSNVDKSITHSETATESTQTNDLTDTHTGRMYGNIGVTTSQQMLQAELDIAAWNLYEHITDIFLQEFCIPIF